MATVAGVEQEELPDPSLLADPDSCFYEFKGVSIHYKVCKAGQPMKASMLFDSQTMDEPFSILLFHGFAASSYSWERIQFSLSEMVGATVLAFDRPAFGLTSRPNLLEASQKHNINPYSTEFSVHATAAFMESLSSKKSILIGHSAGCITAIKTYFEDPDSVAALVLVAPAILTFPSLYTHVIYEEETNRSKYKFDQNFLCYIGFILCMLSKSLAQELVQILDKITDVFRGFYEKSLTAFIRSTFALNLVRMAVDKLGVAILRAAWHNPNNQETENSIMNYTKPLRAKDWDMALLEHIRAILPSSSSGQSPILSRFNAITCPVLVMTGDKDRLVPAWNSRRVSVAIPGSTFEIIKDCGHIPHEEKADEFLFVVHKFIKTRVLAASRSEIVEV